MPLPPPPRPLPRKTKQPPIRLHRYGISPCHPAFSLEASVADLMERYTGTYGITLFDDATLPERDAMIQHELSQAPYADLKMHRDPGYAAYAAECMRDPNHISNLARGAFQPETHAKRSSLRKPTSADAAAGSEPEAAKRSNGSSLACGPAATASRHATDTGAHVLSTAASSTSRPPRAATPKGSAILDFADACICVGAAFQVSSLPEHRPAVRFVPSSPGAGPPRCRCGVATVWQLGRWWCAATREDGEGGCGFEFARKPHVEPSRAQQRPPSQQPAKRRRRCHAMATYSAGDGAAGTELAPTPTAWTPLCNCNRPASWSRGQFWHCDAGRCSFVHRLAVSTSRLESERVSDGHCEQQVAQSTVALLNASAYGPVEPFAFVSPGGDCGLGLFARTQLRVGQFVAEYGGPRLPPRMEATGQ